MRALLVVGILALTACASHAAAPPPARDARLAGIAASLKRLAAAGKLSGAVLVARNGRPVLARAYGLANNRTREPNRLSTRFNLASLGKTFTAVAVARLVEDGKLRFGDTIGRYVPELPARLGDRITVAELLDHTSGLGDFFESPDYGRLRPTLTSLDRYLPLIVSAPPVAAPGSGFHYSNSGFLLLGLIVQRASDRDYYDELRRDVFEPAGMTGSGCFRNDRLGRGIAIGYTRPSGRGLRSNTDGLPPRGTSAGGCYSTAHDLLAFANAHLAHRLVSAELTREITSPKVDVGPAESYGYGFGIRLGRPGDSPTVWHNGGAPGTGAELDVNRGLGYTVVVLANRDYQVIQPAIDLILNRLRIP
jgi:CubicO group peptidase (beta-lactamase class C family)